MLPHVLMTLGFAAGEASTPAATPSVQGQGFILIGTGCWAAPLLVALLAYWR